jgi:hypothetical protein
MNRKNFSFHSETNTYSGQEVLLVLHFFQQSYSISLISKDNKLPIIIHEHSFNFKDETQQQDILYFSKSIEEVSQLIENNLSLHIIFCSDSYTCIPAEFFNQSQAESYLNILVGNNEKIVNWKQIQSNDLNFNLVFNTLENQHKLIAQIKMNNTQQHTDIELYTRQILKLNTKDKATYIHAYSNYFDILSIDNNQFSFLNRFHFATAKDFCYYVVGALNSMKKNPLDEDIYLSGNILPQSEIIQLLTKYTGHIQCLDIHQMYEFENIQLHRYFNQLSLL